jgi:hypothetical protein
LQPQRIRNSVELYPPLTMHRLILALPLAYGGWNVYRGHELSVLFWGLVAATVLFYLIAKVTPYLRLSPTGLKFVQSDSPEVLWSDLKQVRSTDDSMELEMVNGEVLEIPFARLRGSDGEQLRQIVKGQILAMSHEAKAIMRADPITAVVNTNVASTTLPPRAELTSLLDVTPQQTDAPASPGVNANVAPADLPPRAELTSLLDVTPQQTTAQASPG